MPPVRLASQRRLKRIQEKDEEENAAEEQRPPETLLIWYSLDDRAYWGQGRDGRTMKACESRPGEKGMVEVRFAPDGAWMESDQCNIDLQNSENSFDRQEHLPTLSRSSSEDGERSRHEDHA